MIIFFILGAIISVFAGFFGIGGGFILTPTLLLIGLPPVEAIATSLLFTVATSLSGFIAHFKLKNIRWREGAILGISGAIATQIARPFVFYLQDRHWDEQVIPVLYMLLLSTFIYKLLTERKADRLEAGQKDPFLKTVVKLIMIGLIAGFVSTTLGVGGGFIIVPFIITFLKMDPRKAVGTSLFAVFFIVVVGVLSYSTTVTIHYRWGMFLVLGGIIGSQFGAGMTRMYTAGEIQRLLVQLYIATLASVTMKLFQFNQAGFFVLFLFVFYFFVQSARRLLLKKKQTDQI